VHLLRIVSASLDDKNDILSKRNSLCGKINNVLCYFWKRDPLVKLKLLRSYCIVTLVVVVVAWRSGSVVGLDQRS